MPPVTVDEDNIARAGIEGYRRGNGLADRHVQGIHALHIARHQPVRTDIGQSKAKTEPCRPCPRPSPLLAAERNPRRAAQNHPKPQIDDEQRIAVEPARAERFEQANAIGIQPVERRVGQAAKEAEKIEPREAYRPPRLRPLAPPRLPAIKPPQQPGKDHRQHHHGRWPMRDTPTETEMLHPVEPEKACRIHIGQVRADNQRRHRQPSFLLEPCLADYRPYEAVRQIIHRRSDSQRFS